MDLTQDERDEAEAAYQRSAAADPEVVTDGYPESAPEAAGMRRAGRWLRGIFVGLIVFALGGVSVATYGWWQDRTKWTTVPLSDREYAVFMDAANPNNRGFNDGAIGALVSQGFKPVAQRMDPNHGEYYVALRPCKEDRTTCAGLDAASPVVYLGLAEEITDDSRVVHFLAMKVTVEFSQGPGRALRCSVYRGKAVAGEPGPTTYNLPATMERLRGFADGREFADESPDGISYWECSRVRRG